MRKPGVMKLTVLIRAIIFPLIFVVIWIYVHYTGQDPFKVYLTVVMFLVAVARIFLSDRRYLAYLNVSDSHIEIHYYTTVLKLKSINIPISEISHIEFKKAHWVADYSAIVNIKWKEEWFNFQVVQRKQIPDLQIKLKSLIQPQQSSSFQFPTET